jgi:hypothetical protein
MPLEFQVICTDGVEHRWLYRPTRTAVCSVCGETLVSHQMQYRKVGKWRALPFSYGPVVTA